MAEDTRTNEQILNAAGAYCGECDYETGPWSPENPDGCSQCAQTLQSYVAALAAAGRLVTPEPEPTPEVPEAQTHDYTRPTWGHAISYALGPVNTIRGHLFSGRVVRTGDYLILPNKGRTTRYRIVGNIECPADPGDMYFFTAEYAPRGTS